MTDKSFMQNTEPTSLVSLKVSETEKYANDGDWFKKYFRYIIPTLTFIILDYEKLKLAYDLVNNNIDGFKAEMQKFCNPMGELDAFNFDEEILPYNLIHNKVNIFRDGVLKRKGRHSVTLLSDEENRKKNEELKKFIQQKVQMAIDNSAEIAKAKTEMPPEEFEKYKQQLIQSELPPDYNIKSFKTEWELFYERVLEYAYYKESVKDKKIETMDDVVIADRCIVYCGWRGGKPVIEVVNPLFCGFHKSPNEKWLQKGDYVYVTSTVTGVDILTDYGDKLNNDELMRIGLYGSGPTAMDARFDVLGGKATTVRNDLDEQLYREAFPGSWTASKYVGAHQTNSGSIRDKYKNLVWKTHLQFKAFRKVYFLNYMDEYNEPITTVLSEDFDIPKVATKFKTMKHGYEINAWEWMDMGVSYTLEELWVPWKYECTRIAGDVFVDWKESENQIVNTEDPYGNFELDYKGMVFSNRNANSISLVQRAIPWQFQAFFINHLINKELSKYMGFIQDVDTDQIPDTLGQDAQGETIRDKVAAWMVIRKKEGINLYSGTQTSLGALPPPTRSPGSSGYALGSAQQILYLKQLLDYVNNEIGLAMGISPQREAQANNQMTATDNERNMNQSYAITEYFFDQHEEVWTHVFNQYLKNFRSFYASKLSEIDRNESYLSYIFPDGTSDLIKVTPEMLEHEDIGIFVKTGNSDQQYREIMLSNVFSIAQNGGEGAVTVSKLVKMITENQSPEEIQKELQLLEEKQAKRMEQMEAAKLETQTKVVQMQIEAREDEQAHDLTIEQMKIDKDIYLAQLELFRNQASADIDTTKIDEFIESENERMHKQNLEVAKIQANQYNDDKRMAHEEKMKNKDMAIKEKEIESKKEIARISARNRSKT